MANNHTGEKPLNELFSELSTGMSKMFRQEVDLAKTELKAKAKQGASAAIFMVAGGIFLLGGFLVFLAAAVAAFSLILPVWAGALIVGGIACGIGFSVLQKGISDLKKGKMVPEQTMESLKESGQWLKDQI